MALRKIRVEGDPLLRKKSRPVDLIDERITTLLKDMEETMREANGVGLAAPQVGVLRRVVVIDVGDGLCAMINPEILDTEGNVVETEGCLSVPDRMGAVARPEKVRISYTDPSGRRVEGEHEGLMARAICHEIDHLDGILYVDKIIEDWEEKSE